MHKFVYINKLLDYNIIKKLFMEGSTMERINEQNNLWRREILK